MGVGCKAGGQGVGVRAVDVGLGPVGCGEGWGGRGQWRRAVGERTGGAGEGCLMVYFSGGGKMKWRGRGEGRASGGTGGRAKRRGLEWRERKGKREVIGSTRDAEWDYDRRSDSARQ